MESLTILFRQLKRNAQCVPTTLGGGQLGYLALVIEKHIYDALPNSEPFERPENPGTFLLPSHDRVSTISTDTPIPSYSNVEIAEMKADHDDKIRKYNEVQIVEQTLRQQIIKAVDSEYLDALRNSETDMIQESIPEIILYLTKTYGNVSPQEISDKEDELKGFVYDPQQSVDVVFNKIKSFADLEDLLGDKVSDSKLVNYAYLIFNRITLFQDSLLKWNDNSSTMKSYGNFKIHMRQQHIELKNVGALKVEDSSLNIIKKIGFN